MTLNVFNTWEKPSQTIHNDKETYGENIRK